jgi:putative oxidoreductase
MSNLSSQSWGLTVLRVITGIVFFIHGYQKLFQFGIHGVAGMFSHFGIPLPAVSAVIVTLVEFVGGLLLITGLGTRIAAGLNGIDMTVAILAVHLKNGFSGPMGYEHPLTLWGACLCLVLAGGGALSLKQF